MNNRFKALVGSAITAIIGLLGFGACEPKVMYGSPHGDFRVSGLVTDEAGAPLNKARVIIRQMKNDDGTYNYQYGCDTLTTDIAGRYKGEVDAYLSRYPKALIVCQDLQGNYKPDSTEVALEFKNGDHDWYEGVATAEVNFKLKKNDE